MSNLSKSTSEHNDIILINDVRDNFNFDTFFEKHTEKTICNLQNKIFFYESRLEKLKTTTTENLRNTMVGEYMSLKKYLQNRVDYYNNRLNQIYTQKSTNINVNDHHTV